MNLIKIIKQFKQCSVIFIVLIFGLVFYLLNLPTVTNIAYSLVSLWVLIPMTQKMFKDLFHKNYGLDILAVIAVSASLILGEYLASIVIVLMIASGRALEEYAQEQAQKELSELLKRAPKIAHIKKGNNFIDIPVDDIKVGDVILIKSGEVIPVDSIILEGSSSVDESALTGESMPIDKAKDDLLLSGSINQQSPLTVRAKLTSKDSQYEQIVAMVSSAVSAKSPFVRLADMYSVPVTLLSLTIAIVAWIVSGEPRRALEVLVLATPCPLLIATPVALVSGMSKGARSGIIFKNGSALEKLANLKMIAFDKTGTLTVGSPKVHKIEVYNNNYSTDDILSISASAESSSMHTLAQSVVEYAKQHNIAKLKLNAINEIVGSGITAMYNNQSVAIGKASYLKSLKIDIKVSSYMSTQTAMYVAINNQCIGAIAFSDELRPETIKTLKSLKSLGIKYFAMLSGDKKDVAKNIAKKIGITHIHAECLPADKLKILKDYRQSHAPLAFVGDGINDAPSLASADVGIALGAKGSTSASEAADVVIMLDDFYKISDVVKIGQRTIKIAKQSIFLGIGLSIILMIFAGFTGLIKPAYGALLQELVDVTVILLALRAHR
jgi:heavy metal translocating P-type ATPase